MLWISFWIKLRALDSALVHHMNLQGQREGGSKRWRPPSGAQGREQEVAATKRCTREGARVGHQAAREGEQGTSGMEGREQEVASWWPGVTDVSRRC
jgi:hypothetical protein